MSNNLYFKRKIDKHLDSWVSSPYRKPLILRGARQVGKTETIRALARNAFQSLVEVNFERQKKFHSIFEEDLSPSRILNEIELIEKKTILPGKTLLFFDEVQQCPRAITSLRYFYEEMPQLHVVAAGSLLEFILEGISIPVGRVTFEYMYPLNFSEYLMALGEDRLVENLPHISDRIQPTQIIPTAHQLLREKMREYFLIGGMPYVIHSFRKSKSYSLVSQAQEDILQAYREDMNKYANGKLQLGNCAEVFSQIFRFVGKTITYTQLAQGDNSIRTKNSICLLEQAMVIHRVVSVVPSGLPLGAEPNRSHFKCVFLDIGLGNHLAGISGSEILRSKNLLHTYEGRLAEQFIGQQLLAESVTASEGRNLYCWVRPEKGASAEVDYVVVRKGKIIPIEVKSGKAGSLKSLHLFLDKFGGEGICLQDTDRVSRVGKVIFMPLYSVL